jgi:hypothetical protein
MYKKLFVIFLSLSFICMGTSCRKKSNPSPAGNNVSAPFTGCRIAQITDGSTLTNSTYTYYYNDDGTVSRIYVLPNTTIGNSFNKYFVYNKNYILVNTIFYGENSSSNTDSLVLDGQNRILYAFHNGADDQGPFTNQQWENYVYDSLGDMIQENIHNSSSVSSANYQWKNGDITWFTSGTDYYFYTYDSSTYSLGNISASITDFELYGRGIYNTRHIHTQKVMDNTDTTYYNYSLDLSGKITAVAYTDDGTTGNVQITYTCE